MGRRRSGEPLGLEQLSEAAVLCAVLDHYRETLWASDGAGELLGGLGISVAVARRFSLGLADRTLGLRLPERTRTQGRALREMLARLGLFRSSGHEHLCGCLVVPIAGVGGEVAGVVGHRLDGGDVLYATGMAGGMFNPAAVCGDGLILAGTVLDALAVLSAGQETVVAPGRPGGYSVADLRAIAGGGTVTCLGDHLDKTAERLAGLGATVSLVRCGRPPHRVLAEAADPAAALQALLATAIPPSHETPGASKASPSAASPSPSPEISGDAGELHVAIGPRRYRVRGADRNKGPDTLRVALLVTDASSGRVHLDGIDLCSAKARRSFCEAAAGELCADPAALRRELAEVLFAAETALAQAKETGNPPVMSEAERAQAMALLTDPDLVERVIADLHVLGVVGEDDNLLCCYLATISRKAERPFGVVVQSSSAAGKSTLAEAVLSLVPKEDLVAYSALTSQALYYLGCADLSHKVLAVAEDEGVRRAVYALKLLLSEGQLSIASTGKDEATGRLTTRAYEVAGPVALVLTTTAAEVDAELENRLVCLGVDEDAAQTAAVQAAQRRAASLEGLRARVTRDAIVARHANAQRLLAPLPVVIPDDVPIDFPSNATRHRRDHQKVLSIVAASALLHQHQRRLATVEVEGIAICYIEAGEQDLAIAARLAPAVARKDGLAPPARRLLAACEALVAARPAGDNGASAAFTRRELRETAGYSEHQVRRGLEHLVALEHLCLLPARRGLPQRYVLAGARGGDAGRAPRETSRGGREDGSRGGNGRHARRTADPVGGNGAYGKRSENVDVVVVADEPPAAG